MEQSRADGDRTAWVVEVAGKLLRSHAGTCDDGAWQLSTVDGSRPGPGSMLLEGVSSVLGRTHRVWSYPSTDDLCAAHHLATPVPIDASGVVLVQHAWVGVNPAAAQPVTVFSVDTADEARGPAGAAAYPLVPALVAYGVPRDEGQDAEVLVQVRCSLAEAQAARVLPAVLPPGAQGYTDAAALVRRLPADVVRHAAVSPVPWLRYAMSGSSGLAGGVEDSVLPGLLARVALSTLAEAAQLLVGLDAEDQVLCWDSAVEAAVEVLEFESWPQVLADQAGPQVLGPWLPKAFAAGCDDVPLVAQVLDELVPAAPVSVRELTWWAGPDRAAQAARMLSQVPQVARWFPPATT